MLEKVSIPIIWYVLIVGASLIFLFMFGLYIAGLYHFGKPLAPFMNVRIRRWSDHRAALFQVINLLGNVSLLDAREETGGYRRPEVTRKVRVPFTKNDKIIISFITMVLMTWIVLTAHYYLQIGALESAGLGLFAFIIPTIAIARQKTQDELIGDNRPQPLIMPKSVFTINTVPTIPLLDLHPALHPDLKAGLKKLIEDGITTPEQLTEHIKEHSSDILIKGYTYKQFAELYESTRQKYEFKVTVSDVTEALNKGYDLNYAESITAKNYNSKTKSKTSGTPLKWAYAAFFVVALGITIKLIYVTLYGVKP